MDLKQKLNVDSSGTLLKTELESRVIDNSINFSFPENKRYRTDGPTPEDEILDSEKKVLTNMEILFDKKN